MPEQRIVTASLEGMRVVVDDKRCELQEYDFAENEWHVKDKAKWPISRSEVDTWLGGWNSVDRFAAQNVLINPRSFSATRAVLRPLRILLVFNGSGCSFLPHRYGVMW